MNQSVVRYLSTRNEINDVPAASDISFSQHELIHDRFYSIHKTIMRRA